MDEIYVKLCVNWFHFIFMTAILSWLPLLYIFLVRSLSHFTLFHYQSFNTSFSCKVPHSCWPPKAVIRELPQFPTYAHLPVNIPIFFLFSPIVWKNHFYSYLRPTPTFVHYICTLLGYWRRFFQKSPLLTSSIRFFLSLVLFLPLCRHAVAVHIFRSKHTQRQKFLLTPPVPQNLSLLIVPNYLLSSL